MHSRSASGRWRAGTRAGESRSPTPSLSRSFVACTDRKAGYAACSCSGLTLPETAMSSFGTYLVGFVILIIGLGIAAYLLNVPPTWILVGVVVLLGIGILMATSRTKPRDPPTA